MVNAPTISSYDFYYEIISFSALWRSYQIILLHQLDSCVDDLRVS